MARFVDTTRKPRQEGAAVEPREPVLVIAHHPTLARVGELVELHEHSVEVSRLAPAFESGPLDDPFVSRRPITIRDRGDAFELETSGAALIAGGVAVPPGTTYRVTASSVDLVLDDRVVLWLTRDHEVDAVDDLGMVGRSPAMRGLREQIREAARGAGPVLVLGETGSGKELVARALHARGPRSTAPFEVVNVAAIPASVAAAELFGHERGAFTGATDRRAGVFERAHRGVLFLDEIGDLPDAIQPVLLRALEAGEIQPIGGTPRVVDVFVVAATDADVVTRLRAPLYFRLAASPIRVPPLRERGVDIALLLARFLVEQLPAELVDRVLDPQPWLPASIVAELLRAPWPGNVRELRAVAARLTAIARGGRIASLAALGLDEPEASLAAAAVTNSTNDARHGAAHGAANAANDAANVASDAANDAANVASAAASDAANDAANAAIDEDRLLATLRAHGFQLNRTADALGISRTHLDALIGRSASIRKAKDLGRDEIAACAAELAGDLEAMAAKLEVSPRGLRLRMRQLGL